MVRESLTRKQVLALLAENPRRIAALTAGVAQARLREPTSDRWSANDVLAHVRSCADVWGDFIAAMLVEDRPTLRGRDPRTWIKHTNYRELDFQASFRAFADQRAALLAVLEPQPHRAWSRGATVKGGGSAHETTVHAYAQSLARHEHTHVTQIARIVQSVQ